MLILSINLLKISRESLLIILFITVMSSSVCFPCLGYKIIIREINFLIIGFTVEYKMIAYP